VTLQPHGHGLSFFIVENKYDLEFKLIRTEGDGKPVTFVKIKN